MAHALHPLPARLDPCVVGGILGAATYLANLRELGNGVALWLGISPPDLFFYAVGRLCRWRWRLVVP